MEIAEKMCDLVFMIHQGRKVFDGTLDSIQATYGSDTLKVQLDGAALPAHLPGIVQVTDFGRWQQLRLDRGVDSQLVLEALMRHGRVRHFELTRPSLRDLFMRVVGQTDPC
jgi:ABC-2 type transport system ATP-binding protein